VDATVRANVVIATAPFTGAFGQQDFIDRDHKSPDISISMENDNARGRMDQTACETSAPPNFLRVPLRPLRLITFPAMTTGGINPPARMHVYCPSPSVSNHFTAVATGGINPPARICPDRDSSAL
jgi:hypothetical protein